MNRLAIAQTELNRSGRDDWQRFIGHRNRLTHLILAAANGKPRLCVLGAGNCNDLDLAALLTAGSELHLVDLDEEALRNGIERQGVTDRANLHVYGDIDVSGCLDALAAWSPQTELTDADIDGLVTAPAAVATRLPAPFDLVVSDCVLSQLILGVVEGAGESHQRFVDALQAIRLGHLRLLMQLAAPGAAALLCTELVSSGTAPELTSASPQTLPAVIGSLVERQNFFHGLNPAVLRTVLQTDPVLRAQIGDTGYAAPWLWYRKENIYAVYALTMRKRDTRTASGAVKADAS